MELLSASQAGRRAHDFPDENPPSFQANRDHYGKHNLLAIALPGHLSNCTSKVLGRGSGRRKEKVPARLGEFSAQARKEEEAGNPEPKAKARAKVLPAKEATTIANKIVHSFEGLRPKLPQKHSTKLWKCAKEWYVKLYHSRYRGTTPSFLRTQEVASMEMRDEYDTGPRPPQGSRGKSAGVSWV